MEPPACLPEDPSRRAPPWGTPNHDDRAPLRLTRLTVGLAAGSVLAIVASTASRRARYVVGVAASAICAHEFVRGLYF